MVDIIKLVVAILIGLAMLPVVNHLRNVLLPVIPDYILGIIVIIIALKIVLFFIERKEQ